jgi:hypothetical protein
MIHYLNLLSNLFTWIYSREGGVKFMKNCKGAWRTIKFWEPLVLGVVRLRWSVKNA